MVAANARDTISVIDTVERKLVKNIITGTKPHPGRGANWIDPEFGRVWATVHLGEGLVSIISTNPDSEHAWTVVREWELGGNSLFIKTHPKSTNVYCDNTINQDKSNVLTIFDMNKPDAAPKEITFKKKVVHMEFNKDGDEVWISLWDKAGEVVVLDDKTLKEKARITGLDMPTGKFNVYNTTKDIY
jgi:nitrite reductase (NO-forming)/hydroxylamine reductase